MELTGDIHSVARQHDGCAWPDQIRPDHPIRPCHVGETHQMSMLWKESFTKNVHTFNGLSSSTNEQVRSQGIHDEGLQNIIVIELKSE